MINVPAVKKRDFSYFVLPKKPKTKGVIDFLYPIVGKMLWMNKSMMTLLQKLRYVQ